MWRSHVYACQGLDPSRLAALGRWQPAPEGVLLFLRAFGETLDFYFPAKDASSRGGCCPFPRLLSPRWGFTSAPPPAPRMAPVPYTPRLLASAQPAGAPQTRCRGGGAGATGVGGFSLPGEGGGHRGGRRPLGVCATAGGTVPFPAQAAGQSEEGLAAELSSRPALPGATTAAAAAAAAECSCSAARPRPARPAAWEPERRARGGGEGRGRESRGEGAAKGEGGGRREERERGRGEGESRARESWRERAKSESRERSEWWREEDGCAPRTGTGIPSEKSEPAKG